MSMEYRALGDFCTITSSKRIFAEQYVENGIPFYRSREIIEKNNNADISEPLFISPVVYENIKAKFGVPQKGDMLLTSVGTIGIPYIVKDEQFYFKDGNLTWMKDFSPDLSSMYLYYWLSSKFGKDSLTNRCIGSSQSALTIDTLKKYKLFIPDMTTQDAIVSILSAYDKLIEVNNKRIKVLEQMAENLYKEWFVRFRFPGHETSGFENGIPKGWNVCRFSSIANVLSGGTPSTDHDEYYGGNIPFYTPKDSSDDYFVFDTISKLTEEGLQHCNSQLYPQNTIMITARGTVGNLNLLAKPMAMNQSCYAITSNTIPSKYFLFFLIKREILKLRKMASGGVFDTIIVSTFDHIKVTIPDESLIMSFDRLVSPILDETYTLLKQNRNLICQRDLLLPRLMSGKLEV